MGRRKTRKLYLLCTERKSRFEYIEVLKNNTTLEVVRAINRMEKTFGRHFSSVFKSITVGNGSEFQDFNGMEKALYRKGKRMEVFFCHPNSPHERGSNENANELIRRFFRKGSDFDARGAVTREKVKEVQDWLNYYPRSIFGGGRAEDLFKCELKKLGIDLTC